MVNQDYIKQEALLGNNQRIRFLNTNIDVLNEDETVSLVEKYVLKKEPLHLIGVNADKINALNKNPRLKKIVNSCGIINADGASVVLASKFLGMPLPERVAGIDLMLRLIKLSADKGYTVYFLGAKENVVTKTAKVLKSRYSELKVLGTHDGYFNEKKWIDISNELKSLKPDFVFVGITSPTKEYLVEFLQNNGNNSVFMGVGGSFDVISGEIKRAPRWVQNINFEWLYRVIQEPKRLFKRYLFGNFAFLTKIMKAKFSKKDMWR